MAEQKLWVFYDSEFHKLKRMDRYIGMQLTICILIVLSFMPSHYADAWFWIPLLLNFSLLLLEFNCRKKLLKYATNRMDRMSEVSVPTAI